MTGLSQVNAAHSIFVEGGAMGELMRSLDWSQTPLGDPSTWPQSLRSAVSILLPSKAQICLFWGPELVAIYNGAYAPALASKHPWALGRPACEMLSETWNMLKPLLEGVVATGEAFWAKDYLFFVNRSGYTEETYFDVSYDPVRDESGAVGGVFCIVSETTGRVLGDRRLQTLSLLAREAASNRTAEAVYQTAINALATNPQDIPFALLYQIEAEGWQATLVEATGIETGTHEIPTYIDLTQEKDQWQFKQIYQAGEATVVDDLATRLGTLPSGVWQTPPTTAWVVPLVLAGQNQPTALLVLGINPHRVFEEDYRNFFNLVAGNVTTAIANARAFEEEHHRVETLAELNRAKTSFFSNISHEFRTPITLMLSPLEETLNELGDLLPERARSQLELMQRNGNRLLRLVNTLLDFSRVEAGRAQIHAKPTDLSTYTTELTSLFQSAVEQAGLQLIIDCPPLSEAICVDQEMWEKIVLNLLSNAFKFTFTGAITVSLHLIGQHIELAVRDTGTGIPAADIPHLFERFHRVEGTRGRTFEGTGIGLSLVQELVHLHGGTISVESILGEGSTFRVRLPQGRTPLPRQEQWKSGDSTHNGKTERGKTERANHTSAPSTQPDLLESASPYVQEALSWLPQESNSPEPAPLSQLSSPARIFLVDDNADMRSYLHRILSQFYQVEVFTEGASALAATRAATPDLILSDVMMPGMDGFELLRQLRSNPQTNGIPILLLSARAGEEATVEGLNAGADDYLVKPFSARELLARVAANVELGRSRQIAARRRIDTLLSSISDLIYTFDLSGRCTYANRPLLDLWQKTYTEAIGKNLLELNYPTDLAEKLHQQIQQVIATQQPLKDETPYINASGEVKAYEYVFVPMLTADGQVEAVAGTGHDITERKQAEATLRQSEERYRTLFESIDEGFCILEILFNESDQAYDYRFLEINPAFATQTELEDAIGKTARELDPHVENYWCEIYGEIVRTGESRRFENYWKAKDCWLDVYACRLGQPEEHKVAVVFKDVTEAKRIAAEREQILQREQVAREAAERANQIKDEFLAVLSHELRTPLNPILGWTRLLRNGNLDTTKTNQAAEIIERNAKLQVQLIEDLLDISRILQGKLVMNMLPVDLKFAVHAALETVRLSMDAKAIALHTQIDPDIGSIVGDVSRLQQVVWNLLSNAVKFTPTGGQITVTLTHTEKHAQIQITDTGKGIHPDFLPYVFEHFRQEDSATTRKFGGLGLGLAIARQIVELHGGIIQVDSPGEGKGATFTVKLPLANNKAAATPEETDSLHPASLIPHPLKNVRVLVVDDETDSRELTTFVLEEAGALVTAVPSAIAALEVFSQAQPNILVSDIGMPEMDGYALIRQVQTMTQDQPFPAVALTAYAGEMDQQQAIAAGFQHHLSKPIEPSVLIDVVTALAQFQQSELKDEAFSRDSIYEE